mmetsp:Transcript_22371/g.64154  ORF Transcript_22371/g.64154 Transcript_22371/m.64154 type:complete len:328 (+) Transcript_22371:1401-2384(+)
MRTLARSGDRRRRRTRCMDEGVLHLPSNCGRASGRGRRRRQRLLATLGHGRAAGCWTGASIWHGARWANVRHCTLRPPPHNGAGGHPWRRQRRGELAECVLVEDRRRVGAKFHTAGTLLLRLIFLLVRHIGLQTCSAQVEALQNQRLPRRAQKLRCWRWRNFAGPSPNRAARRHARGLQRRGCGAGDRRLPRVLVGRLVQASQFPTVEQVHPARRLLEGLPWRRQLRCQQLGEAESAHVLGLLRDGLVQGDLRGLLGLRLRVLNDNVALALQLHGAYFFEAVVLQQVRQLRMPQIRLGQLHAESRAEKPFDIGERHHRRALLRLRRF